jgi:hypothetical protein
VSDAGFWDEAEIISSYSRAQAIEDGVLVDVSAAAREAGIKFPVALTRAVWGQCVEVPGGVEYQDERGRLWDVISMLKFAIGRARGPAVLIRYELYVKNHNRERLTARDRVALKAVCGPGDVGEPVITIMLPDED